MKKLFASIVLALAFTFTAQAQATFVIQNSITGVQYDSTKRPAGVNTLLTAWWTSGTQFAPTSSGSVSTPSCSPDTVGDLADCQANGIAIAGYDASNNFLGYGELTYVSTTQINFHWKSTSLTDATKATQWRYLVNAGGTFINFGTSSPSSQTVERFNLQPYLQSATIGGVSGQYLVGSLYGCTANVNPCSYTYLKSLIDGTANARTYNSQPTLIQLYVTGWNGEDISNPNDQTYASIGPLTALGTPTVSFGYFSSQGTYVLNNEWTSGGTIWGGSGHQTFYVAYIGTVGGPNVYRQGPWNASGDRPRGLIYFN